MLEPTCFDKAFIIETPWSNVKAFQIQIKENGNWKNIVKVCGAEIDSGMHISFQPVTSRFVRLNIIESDGPPSIYEFQLFKK